MAAVPSTILRRPKRVVENTLCFVVFLRRPLPRRKRQCGLAYILGCQLWAAEVSQNGNLCPAEWVWTTISNGMPSRSVTGSHVPRAEAADVYAPQHVTCQHNT